MYMANLHSAMQMKMDGNSICLQSCETDILAIADLFVKGKREKEEVIDRFDMILQAELS